MASLAQPAAAAPTSTLAEALEQVAALAGELDRHPRFPLESFAALIAAGVPQMAAAGADLARDVALVRAVAGADASTARILDGHLNGVERLVQCAPEDIKRAELEGIARGALLLGVWGADPRPGEGPPAELRRDSAGTAVLRGVKTFCSGAGGVQRALVIARDGEARRLVYADVTETVAVDRTWYRASGLRASESHRVEFLETPVLAVLGGPDELMREPWFSRDAIRTSATWAGIADRIVLATLRALRTGTNDDLRLHGLGRMQVARSTIDHWLNHAVALLGTAESSDQLPGGSTPRRLAGECRVAMADAGRAIAAESARACGSRALVDGGSLDRARRDLDIFLLQHRLDPKLIELGALALEREP